MITADHPELRLIPGCGYSIEFATVVVVDKFFTVRATSSRNDKFWFTKHEHTNFV